MEEEYVRRGRYLKHTHEPMTYEEWKRGRRNDG